MKQFSMEFPTSLESQLETLIYNTINRVVNNVLNQQQQQQPSKEWLNLKDAAAYAGVAYNTFIKFRKMGLKVCEIDGIIRVSKTEIDSFLSRHSF